MNDGVQRRSDILQQFRTPEDQYVPPVMWFWNDKIEEAEIAYQLGKFKESGFCEFFVHPLWGMEEEYLSESFFQLIKYTVAEAKKLGMYFWIYDEYNWPSGMAGGYLLRDEPWTRSTLLKSIKVDLFAGQPLEISFRGQFVSAQIVYGNKSQRIADISDQVTFRKDGEMSYATYVNKSCVNSSLWLYYTDVTRGMTAVGMWSSFSWFQEGYVDTNNPEVVRKYIELTHERYKDVIGDEFGKTVKGVFTDEVNNMSMFDNVPGVTPWTDKLPEEFEREHGYGLLPKLYALHCDFIDTEVLKVRYDYWRTCARLFKDAYMQQTADWCSQNNLLLTGHLSGESTVYWHSFQMGDFFDSNTPFHIPGVDSILSTQYVDDPGFSLEAKLIASVAKFNNRPRVMCETFSGSGWDMKLGEAKRIINRLLVHGINMIVFMGAYYSLDGARKRLPLGYPPSHGYNNPLFEHYDFLNRHAARIEYLSAITRPAGRVLVMIPQTAHYIHLQEADKLDSAWQGVAEALIRLQIEFDFGFEPLAGEMKVADGRLEIRGCSYDTVILPEMKYTTSGVASAIEQLVAQGGRAIFVNALIEVAADNGTLYAFAPLCSFGAHAVEGAMAEAAGAELKVVRVDGKGATFLAAPDLKNRLVRPMMDSLADILGKDRQPFYSIGSTDGVYVGHRTNEDMELIFIANDNAYETNISATVSMTGRLLLLDPDTGESNELHTVAEGGRRRFEIDIPGYHLVAVACMRGEQPNAVEAPIAVQPCRTKVLEAGWAFEPEGGNWLPLRLKLATDSAGIIGLARQNRSEELFEAAFGPKAVTDSAVGELPGGHGADQGDEYAAIATFDALYVPDVLDFVVELEDGMEVYVNGTRLEAWEHVRLWGIRNAKADVSALVRNGSNVVIVVTHVPNWGGPHAIPSAMIRGSFGVGESDRLTEPVRNVSADFWTRQGYRYYSGKGTYAADFELGAFGQVCIRIPTTDVVRVSVNGREAATLPWSPYEADITSLCKQGTNRLAITFTSCYASLMEIEKVTLLGQGVTVYDAKSDVVDSGLQSAPVISIYFTDQTNCRCTNQQPKKQA